MASLLEKWTNYRDTRRGTYEYRCRTRYAAVAERLMKMGLNDTHTVTDVGAGSCQFGQYLWSLGWGGHYVPVDAVLDGTDLETWHPGPSDFFVCIEVLEHLHSPYPLLREMAHKARRGTVITTPNPYAVDVFACDPTHVSVINPGTLWAMLFDVEYRSWFGVNNDSLLAWRQNA